MIKNLLAVLAALVLAAGNVSAQFLALDELKAASPAGTAADAPAAPSCQPVNPAPQTIESDFTASCLETSIRGMRRNGAAVWSGDTRAIAGMCRGAKSDRPALCFARAVAVMRDNGATLHTSDTKAIAATCIP